MARSITKFIIICHVLTLTGSKENVQEDNSSENTINSWEAPLHLKTKFPYYVSGFDSENRPIIVVEFGKWDLRKLIEEGGQNLKDFEKYIDQGFYRFVDVQNMRRSVDYPVDGTIVLVDLADYSLWQIASVSTVRFALSLAQRLRSIERELAYGILVNANFVAESLVNLARPILGSTFSRIDVYGTNKRKWIPFVLQKLPKNQIPEWYGGFKNFTPVAVYG